MNRQFIPLFIESAKMKIIVFGGGRIALNKCRFLDEADITIMANEILPELEGKASKVIKGDIPEDVRQIIDPYDLVIAATEDVDLNTRIRDDALYMGINVNSAHGGGNVIIPSMLRRDGYCVAVTSEGRVPSFPPYMVEELDSLLDERYDRMLELMVEVRKYAMEDIPTLEKRKAFQEAVIHDKEVQRLVAEGHMDEAKRAAMKNLPKA